jgi:predicted nucleic acid-binding protein
VERTSFAVMERLGVTRAVSFDDEFAIFRPPSPTATTTG